ncbi:MAG: hypothetical protein KatS3mg043_1876 [Rhodothermaceae bacterium]|nr:MAG: hypothetical protein KatS3mg043_1876 [Rhodothermaceae bacterium]
MNGAHRFVRRRVVGDATGFSGDDGPTQGTRTKGRLTVAVGVRT